MFRSKEENEYTGILSDHGQTWTELQASSLPNNNSGIEALTLADKRHLLFIIISVAKATRMAGANAACHLAISDDGCSGRQRRY